MKLFRWLIAAGVIALGLFRVEAAKTEARLLLSHVSAKPGQNIMAAVALKMPPGWHTYWTFAGDAGAATKIQWELPPGITAGEILWPIPEKLTISGLTTYIYEGETELLVPLQIAPDAKPGTIELKAKVSWLECEESCIPGHANVQSEFTIGSEDKPSEYQNRISQAESKLPRKTAPFDVIASWSSPATVESRAFSIELGKLAETADFFPFGSDDFDIAGETERATTSLIKKAKKSVQNWPSTIKGLLVLGSGPERKGYEVALNLGTPATSSAALSPTESAAFSNGSARQEQARSLRSQGPQASGLPATASLWTMLGVAFLGGLILNIMPCVLPVIALKILGFVNQARQETRRVRQLGLIYASGVLVSFLILAGFVIGVKSAGGLASWGMQFQNPKFLVVMIVLVTLVALNLFGVFEVGLGGSTMGAAGGLASRDGAAGAFFNGVLATVLATPCTAPFLGAALGFAFTQSALIVILIFVTVGLGLAAPYVILCWQPAWLKFLPKPDAWMLRFKIAMGFPMLATAIWLFWVALGHFPSDGALWLGLFLVVLSLCAWIWGEFVQRGTRNRGWAMAITSAVMITAYLVVLEGELHWRTRSATIAKSSALENNGGIAWERWSPEAVAKARAEGKPVLVDFTASWCLTCLLNKKTSLEIDTVRAKLKEIGALALIGDYGNEDPAITRELIRNKRAAIPLVLVYPADPSAEPIILPAVLTPGLVLDALTEAAKSRKTASLK